MSIFRKIRTLQQNIKYKNPREQKQTERSPNRNLSCYTSYTNMYGFVSRMITTLPKDITHFTEDSTVNKSTNSYCFKCFYKLLKSFGEKTIFSFNRLPVNCNYRVSIQRYDPLFLKI